ncbi:MAG: hypothetical protein RSC44_04960 [Clostridia bacterium]
MAKRKIVTLAIEANKDLSIDFSEWKKNIESKRYFYYDFNKEIVERIAKINDIKEVPNKDIRVLVQALFPQYLECNGLFDPFLLFAVVDGVRIDPPRYFFGSLKAYLNNDKEAKVNRLSDEIKDLFEKNNIEYSEMWKEFFEY